MKNPNPLTDPDAAAKLKDPEWVALHLPRFVKARPAYVAYETFLVDCLKEVCAKLAPLAKVEARAKGLASFAEKILRKRNKYQEPSATQPPDPLVRLTDLCGGRVIAETSAQVEAVCRFIEQAFDIDWTNSEDVRQRLKPTEFGYRSVHYIVIPSEEKLRASDIATPIQKEILGLKAELQVRTLLEHAWSDLGHDLLYKSDLSVPASLKRQFAAVAAVLEGADREFERLLAAFGEYKAGIGAHHSRKKLKEEIERLGIVLEQDPKNLSIALRLGRIAMAIGEHAQGIAALDRDAFREQPEALELLGILLTECHWDAPRSDEFRRGCDILERTIEANPVDAEALRSLAECRAQCGQPAKARQLFRRAMAADPTDPVTVCRYVEFEAEKEGHAVLDLALPMVRTAMVRARKQIEARVNLSGAWSALALFHLMAGEPFAALSALAQLVVLCRTSRAEAGEGAPPCVASRAIQRTEGAVERLRALAPQIDGFAWFDRLLLLARAAILHDEDALRDIQKLSAATPPFGGPGEAFVILSGGCAAEVDPFVEKLRPILLDATGDATFTVVSGGTRTGVSGLAGDLAETSNGRIKAVGYLPRTLPHGTRPESPPRCAVTNISEGNDFTPLEPLQAWTDLLAAGVDPKRMKLLCYAPGDISRAEMAIALGLGARVGLVINPELPKTRSFDDAHFTGAPGFLPLPMDASTLRVFLSMDTGPLDKAEKDRLERAAKMAHDAYVHSATPKDPSLQPWDKLDDSLRESNFQQVAFWEKVLAAHGLKVRKQTDAEKLSPELLPPLLDMKAVLDPAKVLRLAQLEHGRWNVERLAYGWRYAREKDVAKRLSPYLVPWAQVPEDIQKYDVDAIVELPRKLREAGLEIEKV
ncbi:MAG TPA: RyR domain-containing protein [Verrucomicrobiae bacterium]|nr:RyR domain-containing protein [Verrucomicrobiae bacterium]